MYISWIIPVRNGENILAKSVSEVESYLKSKNFSGGYEILIMADTRSNDKTIEVSNGLAKTNPAVRVFAGETGGKGGAVKRGMLEAKGDIRLFSDADNATSPEHFDKMMPFFAGGCDVVISSRNSKDAEGAYQEVPESLVRRFAGKAGNMIIQLFAVWGIWDTQNGFKACTARAAKEIFSRSLMLGFSFDIEMLAIARHLNYTIGIIPVVWKHVEESTVTLKAYIQVFVDVFKIRWNLIINAYK
ncbi:MAG: hypothetical protein A3A28_02320 [Candidatus Sungbacteria bacterium RIFCSPLOWO2_01_FULL_47_32]|uniref:Glycosyltransferase 2-like domain-containing protein n=1 Tax=Candidatus Sungbacteria bacterium RIFCSPHIGHO2_01_FULL_47_32 TaxID=1802264 RepID=A0A1G2K4I8_9BACT|nr:MAG: hypothetical protein UX72_C0033G0010 [Parcubacteria group bacterium GW2011_GWA2_47_10]OGZ94349.1 MAG: hypothetical protein A2633_01960 [Candidatus Sungbacteria bacterium RIFCSPHIGHO2_01_FULL_47_32]OHA04923.1 MAG: hypothetical protein A3A28_02320 [Candidatus Sungbacteria bacterium RIFCSPLOWO2_01_FULL_47_32]